MTLRYQYYVMYKVDTKFHNNNTEFRENIDYNDLPYLTSSIKQCQTAVKLLLLRNYCCQESVMQ